MDHIALFASGSGTNAERIISHFRSHPDVQVNLVLSNKPDAFVLERAKNHGIPSVVFGRQEFYESDVVLNILKKNEITFIVLAGFVWLIPRNILESYPDRILNIHPALLPKHGGKGMYGMKVHERVLLAGDTESGITIHRVNEKYDAGDIIFQARCPVLPGDTPEILASRIHELEYNYYPEIIEKVILNKPLP
jgi:phosphoribosylglycinamide formyltransferase-1